MPDETILEPQKVTIFFGRKSPREQYGSAEASIHLQVPTELGDDSDTLAAKIVETFAAAKLEVYKQLGIDMNVDPLTNVVIETASRVLGATNATSPALERAKSWPIPTHSGPAVTEAFQPNAPSGSYDSLDNKAKKAFRTADLAANPGGWIDQRSTKVGKQPDYKSHPSNKAIPPGTGHWL